MGDETLCKRCQKAPRALGDGQTMCSRCLEDASMRAVRDELHQVPLGDLGAALVAKQPADAEMAAGVDSGDLVLMWLYRALAPAAPSRPQPKEATIMADLEHADLKEADAASRSPSGCIPRCWGGRGHGGPSPSPAVRRWWRGTVVL